MTLDSVSLVFEKLGAKRIAEVCRVRKDSVYNWKARKRFPKGTIKRLQAELASLGDSAPDSLWGIK